MCVRFIVPSNVYSKSSLVITPLSVLAGTSKSDVVLTNDNKRNFILYKLKATHCCFHQ